MSTRTDLAQRFALGVRGDVAGLAALDRLHADEMAAIDRQLAAIRLERDRWAAICERLAGGSTPQ